MSDKAHSRTHHSPGQRSGIILITQVIPQRTFECGESGFERTLQLPALFEQGAPGVAL